MMGLKTAVRLRGTIFSQNAPYRTGGTIARYAVRNDYKSLKLINNLNLAIGTTRLKGGGVPYCPLSKGGTGGFLCKWSTKMDGNSQVASKPDIDRIKQCVGSRKLALSKVRAILAQYQQGRAASSCMAEIETAVRSCDRGMNRQEGWR